MIEIYKKHSKDIYHKIKEKGFVDTQVKGNYSYITAKITEEMYREEQMELMVSLRRISGMMGR